MGVNLADIIKAREVSPEELKGKTVAIDAYNAIYQFLSVIRQPDGTPLKDTKGGSHPIFPGSSTGTRT